MGQKKFKLILVKPSHYDDDGYVIQWWRSPIPSNSLASVHAIALDCAAREVLGPDWEMDITIIDETNTEVRIPELMDELAAADSGALMLIGVQSNQFPRALDIAKPFRDRDLNVCVGGFHPSGVISMLAGDDPDYKRAQEMGISIFAGEGEGRFDGLLCDIRDGKVQPLYNHMNDLPGISGTPVPFMPVSHVQRTAYNMTSFDAGRGCPYQCSFCTIINVQGRVSRRRSADDIEQIIRSNLAQGVYRFFITDDNFARNKDWEEIVDRMIELRQGEGLHFNFIIQVDTLCHRIPNFIEKCARAGVKRVFIGLENINPANLMEAKKRQNKITEYREMMLAWKAQSVITYAGYIIGFDADTYDSVMHDIDVIKRELPIDILEFFYLTPLPGSEDHQTLHRKGIAMDADLNKYDLNHVTTGHSKMSARDWERTYRDAWSRYYSRDHAETILRRAVASGISGSNILMLMVWFYGALKIEAVHPLECGFLRKKQRLARRSGMPVEPPVVFYPKYWAQTAYKMTRWGLVYLRFGLKYKKVERDPAKHEYVDFATTPVGADESERELFQSDQAQAFVSKQNKIAEIKEHATIH
jgi:hypothetical protein